MDTNKLKSVIVDQRDIFNKKTEYVTREVSEKTINNPKITAIVGVRRCGKSTLLKQLRSQYSGYYYLNFEDERLLDFDYRDFNKLYEIFLSLYDEQKVFFFDEIQNIKGWEKFVSRMYSEGNKLFVTGSSAKLLSSELATSLTGRHQKIELFPFSWKEYLVFHKYQSKQNNTTKDTAKINRLFDQYIKIGGFPEINQTKDDNEIKQLYQDILIKDLIVRYQIRDMRSFRELSMYLITNSSCKISYHKLSKILEINSVTTVKNYIDHLENSYLNFNISRYDHSIKKQIINDKKTYCIDTGIINAVSFMSSENIGQMLENIVFIELKRRGSEVYYHQNKYECDFITKEKNKITTAIQVTQMLDIHNKEREINGLVEAMDTYQLKNGLILTRYDEDIIHAGKKTIKVMPIWQWLESNK